MNFNFNRTYTISISLPKTVFLPAIVVDNDSRFFYFTVVRLSLIIFICLNKSA